MFRLRTHGLKFNRDLEMIQNTYTYKKKKKTNNKLGEKKT